MPSVAEFARTVGLHRDGGLNRLVAADEVAVTRVFNPLTAQLSDYMSDANVRQFHHKFTTLKLLSRLVGRDSRTYLLYTSPSPRDLSTSRMPSSA